MSWPISAEHSEFADVEYGNKFSVLGDALMPKGHFSIAMKRAWNWIDDSMIKKVGSPTNPFASQTVRAKRGRYIRVKPH